MAMVSGPEKSRPFTMLIHALIGQSYQYISSYKQRFLIINTHYIYTAAIKGIFGVGRVERCGDI